MSQSIVGSVQRVVLGLMVLALLNVSIVLSPGTVQAATVAAASCSRADVGAAITAAQNGDTVLIPPGTCTWTGPGLDSDCQYGGETGRDRTFCLSTTSGDTKYITIQGAGVGQTVIIDGINKSGVFPASAVFRWITNPKGLSRITGIEIRGAANIGCGGGRTHVNIIGSTSQFRFDSNKVVVRDNCSGMIVSGYVRGVADHNTFDISLTGDALIVYHPSWGGYTNDNYGDHSWALPDTVGTPEAFFMEDNIFLNDQSINPYGYAIDASSGARIVTRYNSFRGGSIWSNHGTDTGVRSIRQYEVYNNTWRGVDGVSPWDLKGNGSGNGMVPSRGGVGVVFNNSVTTTNGTFAPVSHSVIYYGVPADGRGRAGGYGFCDGTNPWDQKLAQTGNVNNAGRRCLDQTGSGYGQLLDTSAGPINTVTGTKAWPQQVAQPSYSWNNTCNGNNCGGAIMPVGGTSVITMGVDLIDGVRPGYTPFTYPHPLTTGTTTSGPAPAPPTGLRVQ